MPDKHSLWRSTPPGIFPICLALLGLGLAWQGASVVLPVWRGFGDVLTALAAIIYLFFLANYLRKLAVRPRVLFEDAKVPPARAGVSTIAMAMLLLATVLLPFGQIALVIWWVGMLAQLGASGIGAWSIWRDPPQLRQFSTFQYLTFVGPTVGITTGVAMGYTAFSMVLTLASLVAYFVITAGLIRQLLRNRPPVPLRPSMTIFLAPVCLFTISFAMLGVDWAFEVFFWLSLGIAGGLTALVPWMIKGGWSPIWSSFTFPLATFAQVLVLAQTRIGGDMVAGLLIACLVIATLVILVIAMRVLRMWASGDLAVKSGAAVA